jgi:hypothetical protein
MPDVLVIVLIVAGGLALVSLIVFGVRSSIRANRQRREGLTAFAGTANFTFAEKHGSYDELGLPKIGLFGTGGCPAFANVMRGEIEGSAVAVFDFSYVISTGKSTTRITQTVAAISTGDAALPEFTLAKEHIFHKIGQVFGYQDIDFGAFPEFSKDYLLRGADEGAIRVLFNQRIIDAYMSNLGCNVEVRGNWLFVYQGGKSLKADQVQPRIEAAFAFLFELRGG